MPLFIPIFLAVFGFFVGTSIALKWDDVASWWKGKKLAIFGDRKVGKTTLITFLTTGSIPESYEQTTGPEKIKGRRHQLRDLDLELKDTWDLPGGAADSYAEWKGLFDEADVVLYLLRIDKVMEGDAETKKRITEDMEQIAGWRKERRTSRIIIVGTYGDCANPDLTTLPKNKRGDYEDAIRRQSLIQECVTRAGGSNKVKVVLGSLKSPREIEALVFGIFQEKGKS